MRDFEWNDSLWCVVKEDGRFAGSPCLSWDEARELAAQHEGSHIFELKKDDPLPEEEKSWESAWDGPYDEEVFANP